VTEIAAIADRLSGAPRGGHDKIPSAFQFRAGRSRRISAR